MRLRELGVSKSMLNEADMISMQRYVGNLEKFLQNYQNITITDFEKLFGFETAIIRSMIRHSLRQESIHKIPMMDTMKSLLRVIGIEELTYEQIITIGILINKAKVDKN